MSLEPGFQTTLCEDYTAAVDHMSLHTADPGTTGANDSAVSHVALTWTDPDNGLSTATGSFTAITGDFTHIGLWDGSTFRQGIPCEIHYTAATDVLVSVTHTVSEDL